MGILNGGSLPEIAVNAGTGAALGSVVPGVGTLLGGALGLGSSLIGSLFGSSASRAANRANIKMQRETNELNYKMFQEQQAFNEKMWNQTNEYNSPENQRRLLEQGGYNPADLFSNSAIAANISSGIGSGVVGHGVQPDLGKSNFVHNVAASLEGIVNMAQAEKLRSETVNQRIKNNFEAARAQAELTGQGLTNEAQRLAIQYDADTLEDRELSATATKQYLFANVTLAKKQQIVAQTLSELQQANTKLSMKRLEEIQSAIELNDEFKLTEQSKRKLNEIMGDYYQKSGIASIISANANMIGAKTQQSLAPALYHQAYETGENQYQQAWYHSLQNDITSRFGMGKAAIDILNAVLQGKVSTEMAKKIAEEATQEGVNTSWQKVEKVINNYNEVMKLLKNVPNF